MPVRVRAGIAALALVWLMAAAASVHAMRSGFMIAGAAALISWMALALALLFIYWPKLDFSGTTIARGHRNGRQVALTFDDGPSEHTAAVLDILAQKKVRATFFFLGTNASRHPELVARAKAEGHAIGNHGMSHRKMHRMRRREIEAELVQAESLLGELSRLRGKKLLRVPHGFKSLAVVRAARALGYSLVAWTAGVWDSDRPAPEVITARALAALSPGCILLLHDGDGVLANPDRSRTAQALPDIIDRGRAQGYDFVPLADLCDEVR